MHYHLQGLEKLIEMILARPLLFSYVSRVILGFELIANKLKNSKTTIQYVQNIKGYFSLNKNAENWNV